jgi:hypothetical protein
MVLTDLNRIERIKLVMFNVSQDFPIQNISITCKESNIILPFSFNKTSVNSNQTFKVKIQFELTNVSPCDFYQTSKLKFNNCTIWLSYNSTKFYEFNFIKVVYLNLPSVVYSYIDNEKILVENNKNVNKIISFKPKFVQEGNLFNFYDCEKDTCEIPSLNIQSMVNQYLFNFQSSNVFGNNTTLNFVQAYLLVKNKDNSSQISFFQDVTYALSSLQQLVNTYSINLFTSPPLLDLIIIMELELKYDHFLYTHIKDNYPTSYLVFIY